ncbi:hypothetical protein A3K73_09000 [Candidatus Pacearchaeota archaeon RBG_13_36_9]|nr:MAG: hypothetical protein A3K73_09000 [Candidatus Pacearchaeota archaeon RBG_13_36_9]
MGKYKQLEFKFMEKEKRTNLDIAIDVLGCLMGASAGFAGGGVGAYFYAYCRGWEGAPYTLCSMETPPALALSMSLGTIGGIFAVSYCVVKLKRYLREHKS